MVMHPDQTAGMSAALFQLKLYLGDWHINAFSSGQLLLSANALHSRLLWVCAMTKRPRIAWLGSKLREHLQCTVSFGNKLRTFTSASCGINCSQLSVCTPASARSINSKIPDSCGVFDQVQS